MTLFFHSSGVVLSPAKITQIYCSQTPVLSQFSQICQEKVLLRAYWDITPWKASMKVPLRFGSVLCRN